MASYIMTSYNALLSWSAGALLTREDFITASPERSGQGRDTKNVANLRLALRELYPGATLTIWREHGQGFVTITIPEGASSKWPAYIPKPAG